MPADVIQVQYDQLSRVADQFGRSAENVAATQQQVLRSAQPLRQGGWQGRGSTAFFSYFLAALASVAQQHPEVIWNAIDDNGDGTYTVTFYQDGNPVEVTVDSEFPVEEDGSGNPTTDPAYSRPGSDPQELWPMIMEKAYAQLDGNSYSEIEGGWPGEAVELLTGTPAERLDLSASDAEQTRLRLEELQGYLDDGYYLTAATRPGGVFENTEGWPDNVVPLHAYSIERVDVENGFIYLRNPWGSIYSPDPLTLEEFNEYYNYATVNQSEGP